MKNQRSESKLAKLATVAELLLLLTLNWPQHLAAQIGGDGGSWELLLNSSGVVAMHMALTHLNTVIIFDQTSSGRSGYRVRCTGSTGSTSSTSRTSSACWAHSMEYDVATNTIRPLSLQTDTWCSSGSFLADGTLQQTGGYGSGIRKIRNLRPCADRSCDWNESAELLTDGRWYATNQILPADAAANGGGERVVVVGGRDAFTYEFIPKSRQGEGAHELPFLRQTNDPREKGNNLYPFVHLSSDGNLFIFANRDSILLDHRRAAVLRSFPRMPGTGGARNYPATGSSAILLLDHRDAFRRVEVMVCGGAAAGAYSAAQRTQFLQAQSSCGRLVITEEDPKWAMEDMPGPRLMSDMVLLPTGNVLIINGATHGAAGWGNAINPVLTPYLYKPDGVPGKRFSVLRGSSVPRMYHSAALLLTDGRVLVGGSNPYYKYNFSGKPYATELRVEAFTPHYMGEYFDERRAVNVVVEGGGEGIKYGEKFAVVFQLSRRLNETVEFVAGAAPFVTHSFSMHQRMLRLECSRMETEKEGVVRAFVTAPPSPVVAPAGYYMITVVNDGIPSKSKWVRFDH